jgi:hypothetical protein
MAPAPNGTIFDPKCDIVFSPDVVFAAGDLSVGRVLCATRVTCAGPGSPANRSAAQLFQSEHLPLEAWRAVAASAAVQPRSSVILRSAAIFSCLVMPPILGGARRVQFDRTVPRQQGL